MKKKPKKNPNIRKIGKLYVGTIGPVPKASSIIVTTDFPEPKPESPEPRE